MLNSVLLQIVSGATQVLDTAKNVAVQAAQLPQTAAETPKQASLSIMDLMISGWYIMVPIGIS